MVIFEVIPQEVFAKIIQGITDNSVDVVCAILHIVVFDQQPGTVNAVQDRQKPNVPHSRVVTGRTILTCACSANSCVPRNNERCQFDRWQYYHDIRTVDGTPETFSEVCDERRELGI